VGVTDLNEVPKRVCNQGNGSSYDQHRGKPSSHVNQRLHRPEAAQYPISGPSDSIPRERSRTCRRTGKTALSFSRPAASFERMTSARLATLTSRVSVIRSREAPRRRSSYPRVPSGSSAMSTNPCVVTNVHVVPQSNECWSSGNSTGPSTREIRSFASNSRSASARRPKLARSREGVTSTSRVAYGDPRSSAANPPITTNWTPWRSRTSRSLSGRYGTASGIPYGSLPLHSIVKIDTRQEVGEAFGRRHVEVMINDGFVRVVVP